MSSAKCFTVRTGKVVCDNSKGAKKNYNDKKVLFSNRKGTYKGKGRKRLEDAGKKIQKVVRGRAGRKKATAKKIKKFVGDKKEAEKEKRRDMTKIELLRYLVAKFPKKDYRKTGKMKTMTKSELINFNPKKRSVLKLTKKQMKKIKDKEPKPKPKPENPAFKVGYKKKKTLQQEFDDEERRRNPPIRFPKGKKDVNAPHVKYKQKLGKKLKDMTLQEQREYRRLQAKYRRDRAPTGRT